MLTPDLYSSPGRGSRNNSIKKASMGPRSLQGSPVVALQYSNSVGAGGSSSIQVNPNNLNLAGAIATTSLSVQSEREAGGNSQANTAPGSPAQRYTVGIGGVPQFIPPELLGDRG